MTEEQYNYRNNNLYEVIVYLCSLMMNEIDKREKRENELMDLRNSFISNGNPVPDKVEQEINLNREKGNKLFNELGYLNNIRNSAKGINDNSSLSESQKFVELTNLLSDVFNKHTNIYKSTTSTGARSEGEITNGDSHFNSIVKLIDKDKEYVDKLKKLEDTINNIDKKRSIKATLAGKQVKEPIIIEPKDVVKKRIEIIKKKQVRIANKQKIILLNRELAIAKKNNKISKIEAKKELFEAKGDIQAAKAAAARIDDLRNKKIRVLPTPLLLFKEESITKIKIMNKNFKSYMKGAILMGMPGKQIEQSWEEYRANELEAKAHKKL